MVVLCVSITIFCKPSSAVAAVVFLFLGAKLQHLKADSKFYVDRLVDRLVSRQ